MDGLGLQRYVDVEYEGKSHYIKCPQCNDYGCNPHQSEVRVLARDQDIDDLNTAIKKDTCASFTEISKIKEKGFRVDVGRRDVIQITFTCARQHVSYLTIKLHKGCTYIGWTSERQ